MLTIDTQCFLVQPASLYLNELRRFSNFGRVSGLNVNRDRSLLLTVENVKVIIFFLEYQKILLQSSSFLVRGHCNNRGKITERNRNFPVSSLCFDYIPE